MHCTAPVLIPLSCRLHPPAGAAEIQLGALRYCSLAVACLFSALGGRCVACREDQDMAGRPPYFLAFADNPRRGFQSVAEICAWFETLDGERLRRVSACHEEGEARTIKTVPNTSHKMM